MACQQQPPGRSVRHELARRPRLKRPLYIDLHRLSQRKHRRTELSLQILLASQGRARMRSTCAHGELLRYEIQNFK